LDLHFLLKKALTDNKEIDFIPFLYIYSIKSIFVKFFPVDPVRETTELKKNHAFKKR